MVVNADDYADAVDVVLDKFGIDGQGVEFGICRKGKGGYVFVGIDTQPSDDTMKFIRDELIEQFLIKVDAAVLLDGAGRHAFLFYPGIRAELRKVVSHDDKRS